MKKIYLVLIILLFISSRFYHLLVLPPFLDELIYIRWLNAIKFSRDWLLPLKEFGWEPLGIWLAGLINQIFPDPLFSLRLNSVIISFVSLIMVYRLAGNVAALFYVLSPIILLHDRLGLRGDNLVILGALMVFYGLRQKAPVWWGLGIAIGLFSKTTAAALPIVVILSYLWCRSKLRWPDFLAGCLSLTPILFYALTGTLGLVINKQSTFVGDSLIKNNLLQIIPWLYQYLTWPVLLLVLGGLILSRKNKLLLLSWLVPLVLLTVSAKILFPRYLLPFIPFLLIYAADCFNWLNHQLPRVLKPLLIIFVLAPAWFSWQISTNLPAAPLPEIDQWQYVTGWPSGYGVKELIDYLQANQLDQLLTYSPESLLTDTATGSAYTVTNISHEKINGELIKEFPRPGNKSGLKLWHLN
ncbi:MAG: glycosyltransferase family 39 protein [Patescibacteria group bacterium]